MKHLNYYRKWLKNHPGYYKEWVKNHPEYHKNYYKKNYPFLKSIGAEQAKWTVNNKIRTGRLLSLKNNYVKCLDCSNRATQYDHRDYSKPLEISPVCRLCNERRGPALPNLKKLPKKHNRSE